MNNIYKVLLGFVLSLGVVSIAHAHHTGEKPAGKIIFHYGQTKIVGHDDKMRRLKKGEFVYPGDTLKTGRGRIQIQFTDGGFVSLQPKTAFKIDEYQFSGNEDGSETAFFNLLEGGLRAVSGAIGNLNKDSYRLKTVVATIGIRGTAYNALLCSGDCVNPDGSLMKDGLYSKTGEGTIVVFNDHGSINVPVGAASHVPDLNLPPVFTDEALPFLDFSNIDDEEFDESQFADSDEGLDGEEGEASFEEFALAFFEDEEFADEFADEFGDGEEFDEELLEEFFALLEDEFEIGGEMDDTGLPDLFTEGENAIGVDENGNPVGNTGLDPNEISHGVVAGVSTLSVPSFFSEAQTDITVDALPTQTTNYTFSGQTHQLDRGGLSVFDEYQDNTIFIQRWGGGGTYSADGSDNVLSGIQSIHLAYGMQTDPITTNNVTARYNFIPTSGTAATSLDGSGSEGQGILVANPQNAAQLSHIFVAFGASPTVNAELFVANDASVVQINSNGMTLNGSTQPVFAGGSTFITNIAGSACLSTCSGQVGGALHGSVGVAGGVLPSHATVGYEVSDPSVGQQFHGVGGFIIDNASVVGTP